MQRWTGDSWIEAQMAHDGLPSEVAHQVRTVHRRLAEQVAGWSATGGRFPLVVGLCGPQGSGKSTLAGFLVRLLGELNIRSATVSLDDFYLGRTARAALAHKVHPLLRTRGVPGTHDVALAQRVFNELSADQCTLPRFDKGSDDPSPVSDWPRIDTPEVLIFEGWCVGAVPQSSEDLTTAINALESQEDPDGLWRRYVNEQLDGPYRRWYSRIDRLVLLAPSQGFDAVLAWRLEQEQRLRERLLASARPLDRTLDEAGVRRFVDHFERLTRHILTEMPARADLVVPLAADRVPG